MYVKNYPAEFCFSEKLKKRIYRIFHSKNQEYKIQNSPDSGFGHFEYLFSRCPTQFFPERESHKKPVIKPHNQQLILFLENQINLPKYSNLSKLTLPINDINDGTTF